MAALWNRAGHYIFALWFLSSSSLPAALRATQACRYLIYSEADFEVCRPAVVPMGVKFGTDLRAKFHPIGATTGAQAPQN